MIRVNCYSHLYFDTFQELIFVVCEQSFILQITVLNIIYAAWNYEVFTSEAFARFCKSIPICIIAFLYDSIIFVLAAG
jgi:hypothetical protein